MAMSAARADATLNSTLRGGATPHVQLHTADPGPNGTANVAAGSVRRPGSFNAPENHPTNNERRSLSDAVVEWSGAQIDPQQVTHFSIWSAATAGQVEHIGPLNSSKTIGSDGARMDPGEIEVAISVYAKP